MNKTVYLIFFLTIGATPLFAYIDPGTGSMLFSLGMGLAAVCYFLVRTLLIKIKFSLSVILFTKTEDIGGLRITPQIQAFQNRSLIIIRLCTILPEITEIAAEVEGTFTVMINDLTHEPAYLQYPDYTVEEKTTDYGRNFFGNDSFKYYHVNSASYILLAKWFDYLREAGVWDNTRIIIVSDHGDSGITHPDFSTFQNNHVLPYNPILLFKDFWDNEPLKTNNDFMTSADVPFLALKDIVENPINPFTGNPLTPDKKNGIYIFTGGRTNTSFYTGSTCLEDNSKFFYVHDSIFDNRNWTELTYKNFKDRK
jgi:hypothetical protein